MKTTDRSAAAALKAAERPDVRALRSALSRVERNFDEVLALQNEEIDRLRRIVVATVRAYRVLQSASERGSVSKARAFYAAMEPVCLEADAIEFAGDLQRKKRPVPKRG